MPTALKMRPGEKKKKKNSAVTAKTTIKKKIALYSVTFKSAVLNLLIIEKVREKRHRYNTTSENQSSI